MTNPAKTVCMTLCGCVGCLLFTALVAGGLAWAVFAIIALVKEHGTEFDTMCHCASHIWAYLLTMVIWTYCFGDGANKARVAAKEGSGKEGDFIVYLVYLAIDVGLVAWGWWELYHANAHNTLGGLRVYKLSEAIVYAHTAILGLVVVGGIGMAWAAEFCCACCYGACGRKDTAAPDDALDQVERGSSPRGTDERTAAAYTSMATHITDQAAA